ncbi:MAG: aldose 1-epimerase, partial [Bryobacteraceae bacterium]
VTIGGAPAIGLNHAIPASSNTPQFVKAVILPGRGMDILQIQGYIPGKGVVDLLSSTTPEEAQKAMDGGPDDFNGNKNFASGGPILVPYANRIRGKYLAKKREIETTILGKKVLLPANWRGKKPNAEWHAMHGLILNRMFTNIVPQAHADNASLSGALDAGDFGGHWLSKTDLSFTAELAADKFGFTVTAKNAGDETLPMGIGWHPYFALPGGDREQARLYVPAKRRALANNYDDVFPTGKIVDVKGTPYDFSAPGGAPLNKIFLDDSFTDLQKQPNGDTVIEVIDPAAKYGVRITAHSKQVRAVQVYAPPDKNFVVVEPQFNLGDPFSKVWPKNVDTGMVKLAPGESVTYSVTVELFVP